MNLSLRQMRAFDAVARAGSFTGGARQLSLTQSAVSMQVQQMEAQLGVVLFDRSASSVTLTEAGRLMLPQVRRILDDVRRVEADAGDLRNLKRGTLRVAAPQLLACTRLAGWIARFRDGWPDVALHVIDATADAVVEHVRRGEAELGFGPERGAGDDVLRTHLMDVPMVLACALAHPLARRRSVRWKDLHDAHWVTYTGDFTRQVAQILLERGAPMPMRAVTEVDYLTTALALAGAGLGVAAVPEYARAFAANFGLAFVPVREPAIRRAFHVYQRRGVGLSPVADAFRALVAKGP